MFDSTNLHIEQRSKFFVAQFFAYLLRFTVILFRTRMKLACSSQYFLVNEVIQTVNKILLHPLSLASIFCPLVKLFCDDDPVMMPNNLSESTIFEALSQPCREVTVVRKVPKGTHDNNYVMSVSPQQYTVRQSK